VSGTVRDICLSIPSRSTVYAGTFYSSICVTRYPMPDILESTRHLIAVTYCSLPGCSLSSACSAWSSLVPDVADAPFPMPYQYHAPFPMRDALSTRSSIPYTLSSIPYTRSSIPYTLSSTPYAFYPNQPDAPCPMPDARFCSIPDSAR
jgi:hypothetical protein